MSVVNHINNDFSFASKLNLIKLVTQSNYQLTNPNCNTLTFIGPFFVMKEMSSLYSC